MAGVIVLLLCVRLVMSFARMVFDVERAESDAFERLYASMAEEYRQDPAAFELNLGRAASEAGRKNPVTAGFEFDERARVTDLGTAVRVVTAMRGVFPGASSTGRVTESESRTYFYDRG